MYAHITVGVVVWVSIVVLASNVWEVKGVHTRPLLWPSVRSQLHCMRLRGSGRLHRKVADDYYDEDDFDDNDNTDFSGDSGNAPLSERENREFVRGFVAAKDEMDTGHLSPAARLFLAGQNEAIDDGEEVDEDEETDTENDKEEVDVVQTGVGNDEHLENNRMGAACDQQHDPHQAGLAKAGVEESQEALAYALCENENKKSNDPADFRGEEYAPRLQNNLETEGAFKSGQEAQKWLSSRLKVAEVQTDKRLSAAQDVADSASRIREALPTPCAQHPTDAVNQRNDAAAAQLEPQSKHAPDADTKQGARGKSGSPMRPCSQTLALRIHKWCKLNKCAEMELRMIKVYIFAQIC